MKTRINGINYTQIPTLIVGKLINESAGSNLYDSFVDQTTQSGSPIDTPKQVKYGAARTSPGGLLSVDANGTLTILKGGPFLFKSRLRAARSGASGTSSLFFWVELSSNGGASWQILGNTIEIRLENANQQDVFFDFSSLTLPTGIKLRSMFARSSTGSDFGDLVPSIPSAALQAYGLTPAPSAQLSVYTNNDFYYK
jgi:hypothetical protein